MKQREFIRNEMERRLFKTGLKISISTIILLILIDLLYLKDYTSVIIELIGLVAFSILYYWSSKKVYSSNLIVPFLAIMLIILDLGWYVGGGFNTAIALLYFVALTVSLIMTPTQHRDRWMILFGTNLALLMGFEYLQPEIRSVLEDKQQEMVISYVFILISFSLSIYLVLFMKDNYERVRGKLNSQNTELNIQSSDLIALNSRLKEANELLERKVAERTMRVEEKKRKILDYAFMNSHHVRAPLVNIIGLTHLYHAHNLDKEEMEDIMKKLKVAADQLHLEFEMVKGHIEKEEWDEN
jgi:signal transduction histidine kinase